MGEVFSLCCLDCQKRVYVGKKAEFQGNPHDLLIASEFLIDHDGHMLTLSGDLHEANEGYPPETLKRLPRGKSLNEEYGSRVALTEASLWMEALSGRGEMALEYIKRKYLGNQISESEWLAMWDKSRKLGFKASPSFENYSAIWFSVPNGTYSYAILPQLALPQHSGSVTVDGMDTTVEVHGAAISCTTTASSTGRPTEK